jgi:hypothetical protein
VETHAQVSREFWLRLNHSIATVQYAHAGLGAIRDKFAELTPLPENPDPDCFVGTGDPNDPATRALASWKLSELLTNTENGGDAHVRLDRLWIVSFFQEWEDDLRPRLAKSLSVSTDKVVVPAMGDLRRFRNDVIHNQGIASARYSARAEVLLRFTAGDSISMTNDRYKDFLDVIGSRPLHVSSPQNP